MPTYDYKCNKCLFEFEKRSSMAENNDPKCCPKCGQFDSKLIIKSTVGFCDPYRMGRLKASDSFRDTLREIKKENPGSTINVD